MRVIYVKSGKAPEVTEINNELEDYENLLGGPMDIAFISEELRSRKIDVVINKEGGIKELPPSLILEYSTVTKGIAGDIFFVGYNDEESHISLSEEQIEYLMENIIFGGYQATSNETGEQLELCSMKCE